jgi:hypothetical protein
MTKLLDADWLRGVQLFHYWPAVQLMIFPKQTKWRKGILNTNVKWNSALEELDEKSNKSTKFCVSKRTK